MFVMTGQDIWSHNKKAIANYVPNGKDLKLIWESRSKGRKDNRNVPAAPRPCNRGFHFVFLWRQSKDVLRVEHPLTRIFASFRNASGRCPILFRNVSTY